MPNSDPITFTIEDSLLKICAPRKEDVLFRADANDRSKNVWLNYTGSGFLYSQGYRDAAKVLSEEVLASATVDKACSIFPILFLYRHHIELVLKRLTSTGAFILGKELTKAESEKLLQHRLDLIWGIGRPILEAARDELGWPEPTNEDMDGIQAYIEQLTQFDPDGQGSRYAVSREGDRSLAYSKQINIRVFTEQMNRLGDFLERLDTGFSGAASFKE